ncbi:MAG: hypothetical protein EOP39_32145 [Rubrivivax sp.]|nr:MAG: hypothetical protein EOP39_32145 [Rubrivivax sp.]
MKAALLLVATLALSGCAFVYDQVQDVAQAQCASNNSNAHDRRSCEKRNAPAHDDYEARRKRMQQGQPG